MYIMIFQSVRTASFILESAVLSGTGKSTFIKKFMEMFVLPGIRDENDRKRAMDELPQSAEGKTIMTTEPKFIPKEAVKINLFDGNDIKVQDG